MESDSFGWWQPKKKIKTKNGLKFKSMNWNGMAAENDELIK